MCLEVPDTSLANDNDTICTEGQLSGRYCVGCVNMKINKKWLHRYNIYLFPHILTYLVLIITCELERKLLCVLFDEIKASSFKGQVVIRKFWT